MVAKPSESSSHARRFTCPVSIFMCPRRSLRGPRRGRCCSGWAVLLTGRRLLQNLSTTCRLPIQCLHVDAHFRHRSNTIMALTGLYSVMAEHGILGEHCVSEFGLRRFFPAGPVMHRIKQDYEMFRASYNCNLACARAATLHLH